MAQNSSRAPGRHFLQIPGPTPVPDRVLRAIDMPIIDHRGPDFAKMAKKALELCEERNEILIRIRKEDAEQISPDDVSHLKIIKDDTLKEPGFIIETNFGDIDGRISVQLDELKKEFIDGHLD